MASARKLTTFYHLHVISDSTGETVSAIAKATCAQFDYGRPIEHLYPLVRTAKQLERALAEMEAAPGMIVATVMNLEIRARLAEFAEKSSLPICFPLDNLIVSLSDYLGEPPGAAPAESEMAGAATIDPGFAKDVAALLALLEGCRGHDEPVTEGDNRVALPITAADLSQLQIAGHNVLKARTRAKTRGALRSFISALQNVLKQLHGSVMGVLNLAADAGKPLAGYGRKIAHRAADGTNAVLLKVAYRAGELLPRAMSLLQKLLLP